MPEIPRALARQFRAVLRRSVLDQQPRGPWPLVLCLAGSDGLTLHAGQGDLAVRYHAEGAREPGEIAFRASALAEFEGRSSDPVQLEPIAFGKGQARWTDGGLPKVFDLETVTPDSVPAFPGLPRQMTPVPAAFLRALDEVARTTAKESYRFGLARVQIRGRAGQVVATDGRQLLMQGGFELPWPDTVLVPRVTAFGDRTLAGEGDVTLGRTKTHVVVRVGSWTFALALDTTSRFPDTDSVIPRPTPRATRLTLDPGDAAFLAAHAPKLPGGDGEHAPVTLDLGATVAVRGRDEAHGTVELVLARSTVAGPPVALCTDRQYLVRLAKLGLTDVQVLGPDKPLAGRDSSRTYLWMPLDVAGVVPPGPDTQRLYSTAEPGPKGPPPPRPTPQPERREDDPMPVPPQANGRPPESGRPDAGDPERWGIAEVIAETEALRGLLLDASGRTARLLAALKLQRRRSRAVQQAMQSLKELQLDR